ncbi:MAG: hypothetical protein V1799_07725 [bacterium]
MASHNQYPDNLFNPLESYPRTKLRQIIKAVVEYDQAQTLALHKDRISRYFPGFSHARKVPKLRVIQFMEQRVVEDAQLGNWILALWMEVKKNLRLKVEAALKERGYSVRKVISPIVWKSLNDTDLCQEGETELWHFRPGGKPIEGEDESEVTLMSLLLGWFNDKGGGEGVNYEQEGITEIAGDDRESIAEEGPIRLTNDKAGKDGDDKKESQQAQSVEEKIDLAKKNLINISNALPAGEASADEIKALQELASGYLKLFEEIKQDISASVDDEIKERILSAKTPADLALLFERGKNRMAEVEFEKTRLDALKLLSTFHLLRNTVDIEFAPLKEVVKKIVTLEAEIKSGNTSNLQVIVNSIVDGSHPYLSLIRLVKEKKILGFHECKALKIVIAKEFGEECAEVAMMDRMVIAEQGPDQIVFPELPAIRDFSHQRKTEDAVTVVQIPREITNNVIEDQVQAIEDRAPDKTPVPEIKSKPSKKSEIRAQESPEPVEALKVKRADNRSSALIAEQMLSPNHTAAEDSLLDELLWALVGEGKFRIAYQCAMILPTNSSALSASLFKAILLAPYTGSNQGNIASLLKQEYENFNPDLPEAEDDKTRIALNLMWGSSCLRPSLLAPVTGAQAILSQLSYSQLSILHTISQRIAEWGYLGIALEPQVIKIAKDQTKWREELEDIRNKVKQWYKQAQSFGIVTSPGVKTWKRMLQRGNRVYQIVEAIENNAFDHLDIVKDFSIDLVNERWLGREIDTHFAAITMVHSSGSIVQRASNQIQRHLRDLSTMARIWVGLIDFRPGKQRGFIDEKIDKLKRELGDLCTPCIDELSKFKHGSDSRITRSAVDLTISAIEDIKSIFDPSKPFIPEEPYIRWILNGELLLAGLPLNADWEPVQGYDKGILIKLLQLIKEGTEDWVRAFEQATRDHAHTISGNVIDAVEFLHIQGVDSEGLRRKRDEEITKSRMLIQEIVRTRTVAKIEDAMALNIIRGDQYDSFKRDIHSIAEASKHKEDLSEAIQQLDGIESTIDTQKNKARERLIKRMSDIGIKSDSDGFSRISKLLQDGDLITAEDFVNRAANGEAIPDEKASQTHFETMLSMIAELHGFLEKDALNGNKLLRLVERGENIGPLSFEGVSSSQRKDARNLLEAWLEMKNSRFATVDHVSDVLKGIGLNIANVEKRRVVNKDIFAAEAEAVNDRNRCPAYQYGSAANGRYRVLCFWNYQTADILSNDVATAGSGGPVIIFWFGRMSELRRRELAEESRSGRRTYIVIDDIVILYLCTVKGDRLPVFFDCTLPLTDLEPYTTTAGLVPPEIFYGRKRELEAIVNPHGSCFIYGGRQLGKTALLRSIERTFHNPSSGMIALYVDLKVLGIGTAQPIDHLWEVLVEEFKKYQVISTKVQRNTGLKNLLENIQEWLNDRTDRRILLLLDEADIFLEIDGKGSRESGKSSGEFIYTSRLKGLMDNTSRRFKVVFAGLHNVLRTTTLANHPLAHFGEPHCIGPLFSNDEWIEARKLVEIPLRAIGYKFSSSDLIMRILSQTNYYPSLIQLYCTQLLQHIRKIPFDTKKCPPYIIESRHVTDAFQNTSLRNQISDRFIWTLQLDNKYEVIAYSIAQGYADNPELGMSSGFTLDWIRQQATCFYPEGFKEHSSLESIKILVEEMIGLGVLQATPAEGYLLRNQNVYRLMGSEEKITSKLLERREVELGYEPAHFRIAFKPAGAREFRSPLTVGQLSTITSNKDGVTLIAGNRANGLDDLPEFLKGRVFSNVNMIDQVQSVAQFRKFIDEIKSIARDSVAIYVIGYEIPWSLEWIKIAQEKIRIIGNWGSFLRFVFIAEPDHLWGILNQEWSQWIELRGASLDVISLRRWNESAIKHWLDDEVYALQIEERNEIKSITGQLYALLKKFQELTKGETFVSKECCGKLKEWISANRMELDKMFGFSEITETPRGIISTMAEYGGENIAITELEQLLDLGEAKEFLPKSIEWAEALDMISLVGPNTYSLNSILTHNVFGK